MKTLLSAMVAAMVTLCAVEAAVGATPGERKVALTIESMSLAAALDKWAQQSGFQIIYDPQITTNLIAPSVNGTYTAQEALEALLASTQLTYVWINNGKSVSIRKKGSPKAGLETEQHSSAVAKLSGASAAIEGHGSVAPGSRAAVESASITPAVEEVIVTGTNISGAELLLQVISVDSVAIGSAGFTRVEDVTTSLPQNFAGVSPGGRFSTEGGSSLSTSNDDRASSVDLRGLGAESTLTLVDGVRQAGSIGGRVFDVSLLPLSMIDRIDVVTGGHAAVYGSDAVAGVVNFVTRRDFDGAETRVSYGGASNGGDRLQASQLWGVRSDSGGFVIGYDYSHEWPLDLAQAGLISTEPIPAGGLEYRKTKLLAQAEMQKHSLFSSGHWEPADGVDLFAGLMYAQKQYEDDERTLWTGAAEQSRDQYTHPTEFYAARIGANVELPRGWALSVTGANSDNDIEVRGSSFSDFGLFSSTQQVLRHDRTTIATLAAVGDGPLLDIAGLTTRVALGVETRREEYRGRMSVDGEAVSSADNGRQVNSAFVELLTPLVDNAESTMLRRLEVSAAGRYDRYDDFGSTFNPRFGLLWEAAGGVRFRAGYSESFRAPALVESGTTVTAFIIDAPDPQSSSGTAPLLISLGNNPDLEPETADTWNFGIEYKPPWLPQTSVSLAYFSVEYTDRLEVPALNFDDEVLALTHEERYPDLIDRTPDAAAAQGIVQRAQASLGFVNITATPFDPAAQSVLDAFPGLVVFDNRTNNLARETADGLDFLLKHAIQTESGEFTLGANITYTLDHKRRITATSPSLPQVNEVGKPVDLRARLNFGWTNDTLGAFAYLNYTDGYDNPFSVPPSEISSWTTVDLALRADLAALAHFARGFEATLTVDNVFDKDPPHYPSSLFGILYDTANATALGRYVSLQLVKQW
jgi:iron complex outermembrane recepter protein